jgi:rusticyanin
MKNNHVISMTNRYVWIGITIGIFVAGIGIGYAVFINTYSPYAMMYQNPPMFNQIMTRNPQFSSQYMGYMMQDPQLRQQMYNYMFQNQPFMQGMMQNPQFQQQYMRQYSSNPQANYTGSQGQPSPGVTGGGYNQVYQMGPGMMGGGYNQGYQTGPGMMGSGYSQAFKTISIKDASASSQLPTDAQVAKDVNTITFSSQNVNIVALSMMEDDAKNMTGSSPPSYAKDDVFVIGNMIDPTLVIKAGTLLTVTSINLDEDMSHNFVIMTTAPPYSYMPMQNTMYGGVVAMMPVLPNDDVKGGYAYELSYQVTLSQPGTYWYVCTYPGHAQEGMYGKIIVQ